MNHRHTMLKFALALAGCAASAVTASAQGNSMSATPPSPDPRVGLHGGAVDATGRNMLARAAEASWNMHLVSNTPPSEKYLGVTNSDLAFTGPFAIQGSYDGYQVWDISSPSHVTLKAFELCPASQSDVSVYKNLLFVSSESNTGRLDCGGEGVRDTVSKERLRGIRIFDVTDINHPKYLANVQTCRGSHTHTVVTDPKDPANVYVYISGSAGVRSPNELPGCSNAMPDTDPNSAHFRIEVIKVPLAHPEQAAIVSSPRIFNDLAAPPTHGEASSEMAAIDSARKAGAFIAEFSGQHIVLPNGFVAQLLDSTVKARQGTGAPTAADSAALHAGLPALIAVLTGSQAGRKPTGPDQCHDITVYPAIGLAGGACGGYGLLLDISDPAHPKRLAAVADSNFSYWHSATFNNDGNKVLFSDEWGGGGAPKCRATDNPDWGADAIFTIDNGKLTFQSYYKMLAAQTSFENCVAHNGSLIPIPGRDVMVQAWYQGGVSVFDWTDAAHPREIAFFDRGPMDSTRMANGGAWSSYWYNGVIVSSEIARGLDIFELTPSAFLTRNEIDAAKTVHVDQQNVQDQQKIVWPASFSLARAYLDQLERNSGMSAATIASTRNALSTAEKESGAARRKALTKVSLQLNGDASSASDAAKVRKLSSVVKDLASMR